jgi:hypothetical protein
MQIYPNLFPLYLRSIGEYGVMKGAWLGINVATLQSGIPADTIAPNIRPYHGFAKTFLFLILCFPSWFGMAARHQHPEQYVQQSAAINGNVTAPQVNPPAVATPATIAQHSVSNRLEK